MHHLIIGAGPAGVIAAETIRKNSPTAVITMIGDEAYAPYSRMAIPYMLIGNIEQQGTYLRKDAHHFKNLNIDLISAQVASINTISKKVITHNGQEFDYDKLLIATGSVPASAPIEGIHLPGVYPCWTLDHAKKIMELAQPGAKVLQMGAGFIGCIIMEALASRGVQLSVVEMGDRMVPRMMGPAAGSMIKAWVQAKGVQVYTSTKVLKIEANTGGQHALTAHLSNGQTLELDLIISATGVKPNISFLKDSGLKTDHGILTNANMQTNLPDVFAAGDCAQAFDAHSGNQIVSAIQPNAAEQARSAAFAMLGSTSALRRVTQINVLDTLGLISTSFGDWEGVAGGQHSELTDTAHSKHISLQFKDDLLVGSNTVGWTENVGALRGLVEGQLRLGEWKEKLLQDPTLFASAFTACSSHQDVWSGAQDERRR